MATSDVPLDDKAKRMRDLLSRFYSADHASAPNSANGSSKFDSINNLSFDPDAYMNLMEMLAGLKDRMERDCFFFLVRKGESPIKAAEVGIVAFIKAKSRPLEVPYETRHDRELLRRSSGSYEGSFISDLSSTERLATAERWAWAVSHNSYYS